MSSDALQLPVINIQGLVSQTSDLESIASQIGQACREVGFFYVTEHGVDESLQQKLETLSRRFFTQDLATKLDINMNKGGRAWRGYFPIGGELTSGQPDVKEGIYFGAELDESHPLVQARTPLHGANLFPDTLPEFRAIVLEYIAAMTELGHVLMRGIALSLGLEESYFADRYTADPLILFRVFNYPPPSNDSHWGVGEHTDYGLLTILKQDDAGGLEVKTRAGWIAAPPLPDSFVCNIGDMLDRMTGGLYKSTPHRVRNVSGRARLSLPFFFDPNFNVRVKPIVLPMQDDKEQRWDRASVYEFEGTYGEYLLSKVAKVFPALRESVLP
jgi:isopenicillin N synthase-like dioxygenase